MTLTGLYADGIRAGLFLCTAALALSSLSERSIAAEAGRPGVIQFSDGTERAGTLSLSPGQMLKVHQNDDIKNIALANVEELRLAPRKESMERAWRFVEAGRTEKEFFGEPYPVRHLEVEVRLSGGASVTGHLYTLPLYVEEAERTSKIVLASKQRGQPGTSLRDLVYPVRIAFTDAAAGLARVLQVKLEAFTTQASADVCALTHGALVRLEGRPAAQGFIAIPDPLGAPVFLAVKTGDTIAVGWPAEPRDDAAALIGEALREARDFFDARDLRGVYRDPLSDDVYALVLLEREGRTTLEAEKSQPWRLGIWRFKVQDEEGSPRLMLAGQGYFFRGILARPSQPPVVSLTPKLWGMSLSEGVAAQAAD